MRGEQMKTCEQCGEEKPTRAFPSHPTRLYASQCRECFPLATLKTKKAAFKTAINTAYPGIRYAHLMDLRHGRDHWEAVQDRVIKTIKALGGVI